MQLDIDTSIPITFEQVDIIDETEDSRFYKIKVFLAHTEFNKNRSHFSEDLLLQMSQESLSGIPIVGYIQVKDDNTIDFKSHEERLIIEKNNIRTEYLGRAYGYILENHNARFEDKNTPSGMKRYLVCDGVLWTKFSSCIEIFENNDGIMKQSMELDRTSIEGFVKDNIFHFTKAKFEAACILSHDFGTGMDGATIEKFSHNSIQSQFQEMLQEYKVYFSTEGGENVKEQNNENKGDETVELLEQKNSLFAKFSNLVDEDIQDIKSNLDQFSLEDLEAKLKELSDAKFALTYNQLETEVRKALRSNIVEVDDYGYKYNEQQFYFADIKDNLVICRHNNWVDYYGIPYSQSADSISLDFESKIAYMADWRPRVESDPVSNYSIEDAKSKMDAFAKSIKDTFSAVETEEYKQLQSEFSALKSTSESVLANFTSLKEEYEALKIQNTEFSEWKSTKERSEKEEIIKSDAFKLFTDEDKKPFIEQIDKYSLDELKDQMYLALGKKASQFSFNEVPKQVGFSFDNTLPDNKQNEKSYASIIREKAKK